MQYTLKARFQHQSMQDCNWFFFAMEAVCLSYSVDLGHGISENVVAY